MNQDERLQWERVLRHARRNAVDRLTALDRAGALLTMARANQARRDIILELADDLENVTIGDLIRRTGGNPSSALDAQRAIVELLRAKGGRYRT